MLIGTGVPAYAVKHPGWQSGILRSAQYDTLPSYLRRCVLAICPIARTTGRSKSVHPLDPCYSASPTTNSRFHSDGDQRNHLLVRHFPPGRPSDAHSDSLDAARTWLD